MSKYKFSSGFFFVCSTICFASTCSHALTLACFSFASFAANLESRISLSVVAIVVLIILSTLLPKMVLKSKTVGSNC